MKEAIIIGIGFVGLFAIPALAQETAAPVGTVHHHHVHHVHHHVQKTVEPAAVAQPAPAAPSAQWFLPHIAPNLNGKGDEDGLSTNVDDCNKGCIGGNPN